MKERKGQQLLAFFVVLPVTSLSILALALPFSDHAYIERASEKGYPRYREQSPFIAFAALDVRRPVLPDFVSLLQ